MERNDSMKINVHAGHNPDGKIACGAVGFIKESTEARKVKKEVIRLLKQKGHTVYDCTVENGTSQGDVLRKIVTKCNAHKVDLDVSIHFNCGVNDKKGNGKTTGTEVYIYSNSSKAKPYAERIVKQIAKVGFKNRGVKTSTSLYVLKNTKAPSLLIECCFVDDKDDVKLYQYKQMAKAIVDGIIG
ncbi:N-acetylmuramoyl-L-alanine amidase [Lachnospiraceae bacterium WCA-693-APC-MOT-I]|uniref:N-acetylmuramoyl-L-alanine amidase n=2 Tax=Velocimicrobium porci TaxID=2606634 RepID=A0A6L5Y0L2_9FIRM|nr:N-acetylmuramoyl-L-alanine amidase [Velocimicrobium porci]